MGEDHLCGTKKTVYDGSDYIQDHTVINLACNLSETESSIVSTESKISLFGHWYYSRIDVPICTREYPFSSP